LALSFHIEGWVKMSSTASGWRSSAAQRAAHRALLWCAPMLAAWLLTLVPRADARAADSPAASPASTPGAAASTTPAEAQLLSLVDSGKLADLRWPDFSDYRDRVRDFYAAGGNHLVWTSNGSRILQADALIAQFKQAGAEGLSPEDYDASRWDARVAALQPMPSPPSSDTLARFDLALTVSAMRFISDLHSGRPTTERAKIAFKPVPGKFDVPGVLRNQILPAANMQTAIDAVQPQYAGYARAKEALAAYLKIAAEGDTKPLPIPSQSIHPGSKYPPVMDLAARLSQLGDLPPNTDLSKIQGVYSGPLVDGVKHFQARNGLDQDGVLGKGTVIELNRPLSYRVQQLQYALERYRWIPSSFPQPPIVVNLPEFTLRTMRRQPAPFISMRVVVGKAFGRQTPVFADYMRYVIFHPYWNVPTSIQRSELVPKIVRNPDYLADNDFEVVDSGGTVITDDDVSDDVLHGLRSGAYQIRQKPGKKNALGPIKFIFPNDYNVYLHGTPAQSLFAKARRDFSHGCIRVENPAELATWVLRNNPGWDAARVDATIAGNDTLQVDLPKPIPVLIIYSTAVVEPDGEVHFFNDIYGYDKAMRVALAAGYGPNIAPPAPSTEAAR
jgi:L,D-transpeptidase YcbB